MRTSVFDQQIDESIQITSDQRPVIEETPSQEDDFSFDVTGFMTSLFVGIIPGLVAGYAAGALCAGAAIVTNVIHNLLPVFVFLMPVIIMGFLACTPMVYGIGVGKGVGYASRMAEVSSGGAAMLVAILVSIGGLAIFPWLVESQSPAGESFFEDGLMPFVCMMVGASVHFDWLIKPEPVDVAPWIVYTVLGVTGFLGALIAGGHAAEIVEGKTTTDHEQEDG